MVVNNKQVQLYSDNPKNLRDKYVISKRAVINTQMSHILNIVPIGSIKMHFFIIITHIECSLRGHKFVYY